MTPDEIRQFRSALGLSQRKAADLLGVSRRTVEDWEAGRRRAPHYLRLAAAAIIYQLPPWPAHSKEEQR